ncbi:phosphoribosylaminoimidazolesuccinocarboxamide synthase [Chloroflexota bacterium]
MINNQSPLLTSDLPLPSFIQGKVRDAYDLGALLLIVVTDRISAFDVVLPCGIPEKGNVLNQLSTFWFERTKSTILNHVVETINDVSHLDKYIGSDKRFAYPEYLAGRSMVVKKAKGLPVECVVRGYLSGSAWTEYQKGGTVFGFKLPQGLKESEELPEALFTPTTKAKSGHDLPISMDEMAEIVGKTLAEKMKQISLNTYLNAREYARKRGIIIADTKMEFGMDNDELILIDELLTPDSSRFWEASQYNPGEAQPSYDKQPVRDWLTEYGWDKEPPAPTLPDIVIEATTERYRDAYLKITGQPLD